MQQNPRHVFSFFDTYRPELTLFKQWICLPIQTHARIARRISNSELTRNPRHRHDIFTEYPSIRQSDSQSLLSSGDKDRSPSLRKAGVTDEKIAIDFVTSAHGARCTRATGESRSLVKSYRVSGAIEGCLRKVDDVRKLRTERKSE